MKITEHVYRISGMAVNQYLIVEPGGLTLIDCRLKGNGKKILSFLESLGERPERLNRILITHADGDHYGALNELLAKTPAKVYAGAVEADAIRKGGSSRKLTPRGIFKILFALVSPLFKVDASRVDEILQPGQTLPILEGLQVIGTPGHTPGHLSFYLTNERVLFAGDSIKIAGGHPVPSSGGNTWDLQLARESFQKQMDLRPKYLCCGHGYLEI